MGLLVERNIIKKISIFDNYLTTSWKRYKIRPYGRRIETRMRSTEYRMVSVSVTLSDPSRSWHSSASNNSKMLQHRAILKMARCVWTDHRPHRQPACLLTGDLSLSIPDYPAPTHRRRRPVVCPVSAVSSRPSDCRDGIFEVLIIFDISTNNAVYYCNCCLKYPDLKCYGISA